MAKVSIAEFGKAQPVDPALFGEDVSAGWEALGIFARERDPLHAHLVRLAKGGVARWADSATGHLVYVWQGAVGVGGVALPAGSVFEIEHGASAEARATAGDTVLLVFNQAIGADRPGRAGGHVHRLPAERVPRKVPLHPTAGAGGAIFADAGCPTCELWLHENIFHEPHSELGLHYHDEDEIIVVTGGEIILGPRSYGPGTAIAIARNTRYGFRTGPEGMTFINFRASHPFYRTADGSTTLDEQKAYRDALGEIPYV
jgi:hypothetical protein